MRNIKINSSKAFSLIEMIGVLAIIGILASVVAPKVFDAIRDAKITGAAGVNNAIKSATVDYARKYRTLPLDGGRAPAGGTYTRTYGDGATVTQANCTFGDVLISEGMLDRLTIPIGPAGTPTAATLGTNTVTVTGTGTNATLSVGALNYPAIICFNSIATNETTKLFTGSANSIRVAALVIPQLTTLEAAGLKTKIDGPFDESVKSAYEIVNAAVTRVSTSAAIREAITRGNCLLFSNTTSGGYNALLYTAHE
jgi:prepilin-type N-terminal cleavage/methylation domain-containing protein